VACVLQNSQEPLQEGHRPEVVEVAADARGTFGGRRHVRLPAHPGRKAVRGGRVTDKGRGPVAAQRLRERRRLGRYRGQPALQESIHLDGQGCVGRAGERRVGSDGVRLEGEQPAVQARPERARRDGRGPQRLRDAPVDRLEAVQRGLGLADLHLGARPAPPQRTLGQMPGEERLARAVLAANGLEDRRSAGHCVQCGVECRAEAVEPDGEQVQPVGGHGAAAQRIDHLAAAPGGDCLTHSWDHSS